jgi:hypothetical protein
VDDDQARRSSCPSVDLLRDWIDESYAAVAPKTLVQRMRSDAVS